MDYLKRFTGFIDHCSDIFHLAVDTSLQNVIRTALSVSLLANLFYWQNESSASKTSHFLEENEILPLVSFQYWHNQKYTWKCTFIKHSLKHKVVIFAEFLKHMWKS